MRRKRRWICLLAVLTLGPGTCFAAIDKLEKEDPIRFVGGLLGLYKNIVVGVVDFAGDIASSTIRIPRAIWTDTIREKHYYPQGGKGHAEE